MKFGKAQNFKIVVGYDPLRTQTVRGYRVCDIDVDIGLMVHKCYHPNGVLIKRRWGVCEYTTGQGIDLMGIKATSRKMAVVAALKQIKGLGESELKKTLLKAPKVNGKEYMQNATYKPNEKEPYMLGTGGLDVEDNQASKVEGTSVSIKRP